VNKARLSKMEPHLFVSLEGGGRTGGQIQVDRLPFILAKEGAKEILSEF
jgi:hypothetical protein